MRTKVGEHLLLLFPNAHIRSCPAGPNPTIKSANEVQIINCTCPSTGCVGYVQLCFAGEVTGAMPLDATPELVKYRLEQLSTIQVVNVNTTSTNGSFCSVGGAMTKVGELQLTGAHVHVCVYADRVPIELWVCARS
jgi:hypothetical protein